VDESGQVVGRHAGIHRFTVGQRKGLGLSSPPAHRCTYSRCAPRPAGRRGAENVARADAGLTASGVNWICRGAVRHPACRGAESGITIRRRRPRCGRWARDARKVVFERAAAGHSPGQAVVFYDGAAVIGGGMDRLTFRRVEVRRSSVAVRRFRCDVDVSARCRPDERRTTNTNDESANDERRRRTTNDALVYTEARCLRDLQDLCVGSSPPCYPDPPPVIACR